MSVLRQTFFSDAPISEEKAGEAKLPSGSQELLAGLDSNRSKTTKKPSPRLTAKTAPAKKSVRKLPPKR